MTPDTSPDTSGPDPDLEPHREVRLDPVARERTLVRPPAEVVDNAMRLEAPDAEVGDLLLALLGFDATVLALATSPRPRAGRVLPAVLSWLLLD